MLFRERKFTISQAQYHAYVLNPHGSDHNGIVCKVVGTASLLCDGSLRVHVDVGGMVMGLGCVGEVEFLLVKSRWVRASHDSKQERGRLLYEEGMVSTRVWCTFC
jgi:hypothetical protein